MLEVVVVEVVAMHLLVPLLVLAPVAMVVVVLGVAQATWTPPRH